MHTDKCVQRLSEPMQVLRVQRRRVQRNDDVFNEHDPTAVAPVECTPHARADEIKGQTRCERDVNEMAIHIHTRNPTHVLALPR